MFFVVAKENWCEASSHARAAIINASRLGHAEEILRLDVRAAFHGWPHLHVSLLPKKTSGAANKMESVSLKLARSST